MIVLFVKIGCVQCSGGFQGHGIVLWHLELVKFDERTGRGKPSQLDLFYFKCTRCSRTQTIIVLSL